MSEIMTQVCNIPCHNWRPTANIMSQTPVTGCSNKNSILAIEDTCILFFTKQVPSLKILHMYSNLQCISLSRHELVM